MNVWKFYWHSMRFNETSTFSEKVHVYLGHPVLKTERQTMMIYYSTIHALELIYFDSNTQETIKSNFPPLHWRIRQIILTVTKTFTCNFYVYYASEWRYTSNVRERGRKEGWRQKNGCNSRNAIPTSNLLQNKTRSCPIGYVVALCYNSTFNPWGKSLVPELRRNQSDTLHLYE